MKTNDNNVSEMRTYTVIPEPFSGSRERAVVLTSMLPEDLSNAHVIIDATDRKAYAQGFVDELCKQVAEKRQAATVTIVSNDKILRQRAETSAQLRNFSNRLFFC